MHIGMHIDMRIYVQKIYLFAKIKVGNRFEAISLITL